MQGTPGTQVTQVTQGTPGTQVTHRTQLTTNYNDPTGNKGKTRA